MSPKWKTQRRETLVDNSNITQRSKHTDLGSFEHIRVYIAASVLKHDIDTRHALGQDMPQEAIKWDQGLNVSHDHGRLVVHFFKDRLDQERMRRLERCRDVERIDQKLLVVLDMRFGSKEAILGQCGNVNLLRVDAL